MRLDAAWPEQDPHAFGPQRLDAAPERVRAGADPPDSGSRLGEQLVRGPLVAGFGSAGGRERCVDAVELEVSGHLAQQAQQLCPVVLGQLAEQGGGLFPCGYQLLCCDSVSGRGE